MLRNKKIIYAIFALCLLLAMPCLAENFLIIKKKDGTPQKVPLDFPPEQIESFQVEQAPGSIKTEETRPSPTQSIQKPRPESGAEPSEPMIFKKPGSPQMPTGPRSAPIKQESDDTDEEEAAPVQKKDEATQRKPVTGPVSAISSSKGQFYVNIYHLPDNIKALPDFSAFRPVKQLTTDRINLDPGKGNEPAGISGQEPVGMRFMGTFMVSGEGIFRWRLHSKDGSRMHIDDKTLIENDGLHEPSSKTGFLHLGEGIHTIIIDNFSSKGAPVLQLFVQPPDGPEQLFSISNTLVGWKEPEKPYDVMWGQVYFVPKGNYPEGPDFNQLSPIGRVIASELNLQGTEGIPGLPGRKDMIGVRYQGFFNVTGAGIFAFRLAANNFARLSVGNQNIVEIAGAAKNDPDGKIGWAFLQQGSYPISVDYFHNQGPNKLGLWVTSPIADETLFTPSRALDGFASESGKVSLIPAFVYFLKPGPRKLPNYNKMSPSGMFFSKAVDFPANRGSNEFPGVPKRDEWLGLRFYVKFTLSDQEAGTYKFRVVANDAARLIIGKKMAINIEAPVGKVIEQTGTVQLSAGSQEMFLDYMHTTGPNALQLFITPPGGEEKVFAFQ